jgi:hypothetical protein
MPNILIAKAVAALETSVASIIGCDESDATKREALVETFSQFATYMERNGAMAKSLADESGDVNVGASDHHASKVADLLVEAKSFPDRAAALQHLLHKPSGQALLSRMHKAADQTGKEHPIMDRTTELREIAKAGGIVAVAKAIVDENRSYGITEHEFVALATEHAKAQHPNLTDAAAFAKLYQIPKVWRACAVLKSMPFVADLTPVQVGGDAAQAVNDPSEAIAQLKQLGADRWPTESAASQFERALTDPANHKLARLAVPIPRATTSFPYPR